MAIDVKVLQEKIQRESATVKLLQEEIGRVIVGQSYLVERLLMFSFGVNPYHCLLKTL